MPNRLRPITVQEQVFLLPPLHGGETPREAHVVRATFHPSQLSVTDNRDKKLQGLFAAPEGARARDLMAAAQLQSARVIAGGIYFGNPSPEAEDATRKPVGFVYFNPAGGEGRVISEAAPFETGGFLFLDQTGQAKLVRRNAFAPAETDMPRYRLIIQSNLILVADGKEDQNKDTTHHPRSALAVNEDGALSLFAVKENLGVKEFGDILVKMGVRHAINLDGGPSVQMVERQKDGKIKDWIPWKNGEFPFRMPLLFVVQE